MLELGKVYVARGPSPDAKPKDAGKHTSGWWEPPQVTVVSIDEDNRLYRTEGGRQAAPVIAFGAEAHWREVLA